jgi:hypothetical protein
VTLPGRRVAIDVATAGRLWCNLGCQFGGSVNAAAGRGRVVLVEWDRSIRLALAGAVCLAITNCGLYQGVEEFEAYRSAFEKTYGASTAILDQLAVQERALFLRTRGKISPTIKFDPNLARYYTDVGDPPGTAAFRHALDSVKLYDDLLYGLSSGQTAATLVSKIAALNTKITQATTDVGALAGFATGTGQADLLALSVGLNQTFTEIAPFLQIALTARSREEFRIYVVKYYPVVWALLVELRQGTTVIFPVLTASTLRRVRNAADSNTLTSDEIKKLDTYRKLLADWVILIDTTTNALDQVKLAVEAPPTISGSILGLTTVAVELETASQAARKHLAELSVP